MDSRLRVSKVFMMTLTANTFFLVDMIIFYISCFKIALTAFVIKVK